MNEEGKPNLPTKVEDIWGEQSKNVKQNLGNILILQATSMIHEDIVEKLGILKVGQNIQGEQQAEKLNYVMDRLATLEQGQEQLKDKKEFTKLNDKLSKVETTINTHHKGSVIMSVLKILSVMVGISVLGGLFYYATLSKDKMIQDLSIVNEKLTLLAPKVKEAQNETLDKE